MSSCLRHIRVSTLFPMRSFVEILSAQDHNRVTGATLSLQSITNAEGSPLSR